MPYEVRLTIFLVIAGVTVLAFAAWFLYRPIKRLLWRHNVTRMFYRHVLKVARNGDYYLLNDVAIDDGGDKPLIIPHILGGDKFIYVITDYYFEGAISARADDKRWVYYRAHNRKSAIPNPLMHNKSVIDFLAMNSGISTAYMVGIVLINDDCYVNAYENTGEDSLLVPASRLEKVVEAYEKKDVKPFVKKELWQTVLDLKELSEKNHERERETNHQR